MLENAGHGGAEAAPIARKMMDNYFKDQTFPEHKVIEYLGQEPELPENRLNTSRRTT